MRISRERAHPVYVISDEAYSDYVFDADDEHPFVSIASVYPYSILCYTYNKLTLAMSQRIGYLIISPLMPQKQSLRSLIPVLQIAFTWCYPNADVMESIPFLESFRDQKERLQPLIKKKDSLVAMLKGIGYKLLCEPEGTFYTVWETPIEDDVQFAIWLYRKNVLVMPGSNFGGGSCFRICLTATEEMIERSRGAFDKCFRKALEWKGGESCKS